jgi:hypothetical protein
MDLRAAVAKGIEAKKPAADIAAGLDLPWYEEWTGKAAKECAENIGYVYTEMMGKIEHDRLGLTPSPLDWRAVPGSASVAAR